MKFFARVECTKHILVVDIGTATVNGFLVRASPGRTPEILSSKRLDLKLGEDLDFGRVWRQVKTALRDLAVSLKGDWRGQHLDTVFAVLSSPWYVSQSRLVHMEPQEEFFVTERILADLVREEEELFKKKMQERLSLAPGELVLLESNVMKTALNGYRVRSPFKKKARFFDMAVYTSLARKEVVENISEIFRQAWREADVKIHSEPIVLFQALQGALDFEEGFLLLDVGGEITEIFLMRGFMIENVATFPRGGNFLARRLAARLGVSPQEATGFLKVQGRGDAKESLKNALSSSLEDGSSQWADFFSKALTEISRVGYLPPTLVFLGGGAGIDALKAKTESESLSKFTILGKPFRTLTVLPEHISKSLEGTAVDRKDPQFTLPLLLVLSASARYGI